MCVCLGKPFLLLLSLLDLIDFPTCDHEETTARIGKYCIETVNWTDPHSGFDGVNCELTFESGYYE